MCGFAGFLRSSAVAQGGDPESIALRMGNTLVHRGPDDGGTWVDPAAGIALAHRRLSIVDLSPQGHQPMHSADGRHVVAFNGEIYNFGALRSELERIMQPAPAWRGHSDTEVLLAAVTHWGIEGALCRFVGMFAFALWDREERTLILARDRMGEKPLYYGWQNGVLLFGSELKALRAHPAWRGEIDRDALALYLRHNYIPAPHTIYRGISKLVPGTCISVPAGSDGVPPPAGRPYWSLTDVALAGPDPSLTPDLAVRGLEQVLGDAIAGEMVADVPLGAFLSGGIDSSTVVALMQARSNRPVQTFTIGFREEAYDEAKHAAAVARHLGTQHTEWIVTPQEAMDVIPALPQLYDEPFGDSSQIPTHLVSRLARRHVTVSLSGDGGDELFCGYNRYQWCRQIAQHLRFAPLGARRILQRLMTLPSPAHWDVLFRATAPFLPARLRRMGSGDRMHKLAGVVGAGDAWQIYLGLVSFWDQPGRLVAGAREPRTLLTDPGELPRRLDTEPLMMLLDGLTYLPDDILVKVDRAAMGVSLETRVPLLDHRVVEYAWRMPMAFKQRDGISKWALRQVLHRHVPQALFERPKMGFGVPLDSWLRGPLRDWAEALLDERRLRNDGFLDPAPVRRIWLEHQSGRRNWQYHLWGVLMFQAWLDAERGAVSS